jgi:hypothetical protein
MSDPYGAPYYDFPTSTSSFAEPEEHFNEPGQYNQQQFAQQSGGSYEVNNLLICLVLA